jgi:hypothetical protein
MHDVNTTNSLFRVAERKNTRSGSEWIQPVEKVEVECEYWMIETKPPGSSVVEEPGLKGFGRYKRITSKVSFSAKAYRISIQPERSTEPQQRRGRIFDILGDTALLIAVHAGKAMTVSLTALARSARATNFGAFYGPAITHVP